MLLRRRSAGGTALCRLACGGRGRGTRPARPRSGLRAAVRATLFHRLDRPPRDDVGLPYRRARAVRRRRPDGSEIVALHGDDGRLGSCDVKSGERLPFSFMFSFSGRFHARSGSEDTVGRDQDGFDLYRCGAGTDDLLETTMFAALFAAGDVRSGSTKRCATAVGEGSMAVQFVDDIWTNDSRPDGAVNDVVCSHLDVITVRELPTRSTAARTVCESAASGGTVDLPDVRARGWLWTVTQPACVCARDTPKCSINRLAEPGEDWRWCYVDEVAFIVEGIRGAVDHPAVAAHRSDIDRRELDHKAASGCGRLLQRDGKRPSTCLTLSPTVRWRKGAEVRIRHVDERSRSR